MEKIDEKENGLKAYFLGPQSANQFWVEKEIHSVFSHWFKWRKSLYPEDGSPITKNDQSSHWFKDSVEKLSSAVDELSGLYREETPKFTPRYIGHMVAEITLPALFGHIVNLLHNPNLASQEVSKIGGRLEKEAITAINSMIGFDTSKASGHFTSGGTIANFEAIWRARYRLDHWISLSAFLSLEKKQKIDVFTGAHLGWEKYEDILKSYNISEGDHQKYSYVAQNPWQISRAYEDAFGHAFDGPVILVPGNKHYSWQKGASIFGFGEKSFWGVELDHQGKLCINDLRIKIEAAKLAKRPILMVVSVSGTTELGDIDPVEKVQDLLEEYKEKEGLHIWHHVDAAYGGFFLSLLGDKKREAIFKQEVLNSLRGLKRAESVTMDPHKLGYVPYACGAIVLKDHYAARVSSFKAPYLLQSPNTNTWSSTFEGSRSASGAAATWMTHKVIGLNPSGLGAIIHKGILAKNQLRSQLENIKDCYVVEPSDTNVLCFLFAKSGELYSETNKRTLDIFEKVKNGTEFAISKTHLGVSEYALLIQRFGNKWDGVKNTEDLCLLRVVLMNPFVISENSNINYLEEFVSYLEPLIDWNS